MPDLNVKGVPSKQRDVAHHATTTLHALERAVTLARWALWLRDSGLARWQQFRGYMDDHDLLGLLHEDSAVTQPLAFDSLALLERAEGGLGRLSAELV